MSIGCLQAPHPPRALYPRDLAAVLVAPMVEPQALLAILVDFMAAAAAALTDHMWLVMLMVVVARFVLSGREICAASLQLVRRMNKKCNQQNIFLWIKK